VENRKSDPETSDQVPGAPSEAPGPAWLAAIKRGATTLTAKFMFGLGMILLCIISIFSFLTYDYLKKIYIREAYEKTDLVLGHIDATMEYARDELRPQIFHALPGDVFIRQVMSSSFMNMGIMKRFIKRFPHYIYRRVAIDPMNPANKANSFEEGFIRQFRSDPASKRQWKGLITRDSEDYFLQLKAIVMEEACLLCHGDPASSPESITNHYGKMHGRHWKVGEVVGLESIAVPVRGTFGQLRQVVFSFFLFGIAGTAVLFAGLNYFHYRLAVVPLKRVSSFFKDVVNRHRGLDVHFDAQAYEEVSELADSFNRMMGYLKESEEERKEMEERMLQASKLASIGQLAAGVAHEINNPLSLILGYTKMLRKQCPDEGQTKEDLDIVYNNARLCKKIVEDLLSFSHQTKADHIPVNVNASIDAAVAVQEEMFRSGGITVIREYDPGLPSLSADGDKIKRVFTNLLLNSYQAMKPGGSITIRTEFDRERNGLRIIFSDTGSGVAEEIKNKIFEPFFTTKPPGQGTGLGLAVSYGIVKEHKGEITVKSGQGNGAVFTLWFPLNGGKE
jgi:signal transduction histidine kinase